MEQLKAMKQTLIACAQSQMGNLANVDAKELGEVIDMIKDIEEAIYYCTITEAMTEKKDSGIKEHYYYNYPQGSYDDRSKDRENGMMYYSERNGNRSRNVPGPDYRDSSNMSNTDWNSSSSGKDSREGRSPQSRKSYMESKELHYDKAHQLKELEKYMTELTQDILEMVEDASPEEKQYLEKRISTLSQKIGQVK